MARVLQSVVGGGGQRTVGLVARVLQSVVGGGGQRTVGLMARVLQFVVGGGGQRTVGLIYNLMLLYQKKKYLASLTSRTTQRFICCFSDGNFSHSYLFVLSISSCTLKKRIITLKVEMLIED